MDIFKILEIILGLPKVYGSLPDPEEFQNFQKKFLRIYGYFQNPGNNFRITKSFRIASGSGRVESTYFQDE
jgi:hypothetical protein